jgi:lysophosphatidic acid acyltransferase / lysophosphatidylinositol acyltransferase
MAGWFSNVKRSPLAALLMAITYFMSGIFINLCQLTLWICVRTFDKTLYRRLNYYLAYTLYSRE